MLERIESSNCSSSKLCCSCLADENWFLPSIPKSEMLYSNTQQVNVNVSHLKAKQMKQFLDFTVSKVLQHFFLQEQAREVKEPASLPAEVSPRKTWNSAQHILKDTGSESRCRSPLSFVNKEQPHLQLKLQNCYWSIFPFPDPALLLQ